MSAVGIRHIPLARVSPVVGSWVRSTCATHQHVGDTEFYTVTPTRTTEPVSFIHRVTELLRGRDALLRAPAIRDVVDIIDGRLAEVGDIGGLSIVFTDDDYAVPVMSAPSRP